MQLAQLPKVQCVTSPLGENLGPDCTKASPVGLEQVAALCCGAHPPLGLLPFGPAAIRTVARPMSMNAYKVDIAQTLVERTLLSALA